MVSFSPPSTPLHGPTRRRVLRLFGLVGLATLGGCRAVRHPPAPSTAGSAVPPAPTPSGSRVNAVVARVAAAERGLLAAYDDAMARFPDLAARLQPLRADHAAHLVGLVPGSSTAPPSASPSASPNVTVGSGAPASSASASATAARAAAVAQLAALERTAAAGRLGDVAASSGSLARLIASIGGCEASHAALLERS